MGSERVLYWGSGSPPCWRAMIALELKGLAYESKLLEFSKGEHKSEEVMALNPRGQLPTFKDGDAIVNESVGIATYLDMKYPDKPYIPADPVAKAKVLQRVFEAVNLERTMGLYARAKFTGKELPDEKESIEEIKKELSFWEGYAGQQKYLATDELTLADIVAGPFLLVMCRFGMTLGDYPNLKKYTETFGAHPAVSKTSPPHWKETEPTKTFMSIA